MFWTFPSPRLVLVSLSGLALTACSAPAPPTEDSSEPIGEGAQALTVPSSDCGTYESDLRVEALARMNAAIDEQKAHLPNEVCRWDVWGGGCPNCGMGSGGFAERGVGGSSWAGGTSAPPPSSSAPSRFTGTNNQVANVDEADFVKFDGQYIYTVGSGSLRIVRAWPVESAREESKLAIAGNPRKLLVEGNRAVVLSSHGRTADECTYGYDCSVVADESTTDANFVDISDRAHPIVTRTIHVSAGILDARASRGLVHLVFGSPDPFKGVVTYVGPLTMSQWDDPPPSRSPRDTPWFGGALGSSGTPSDFAGATDRGNSGWSRWPDGSPSSPSGFPWDGRRCKPVDKDATIAALESLRIRNADLISKAPVLPRLGGDGKTSLRCERLPTIHGAESSARTVVGSAPFDGHGEVPFQALPIEPGIVHASPSALYLAKSPSNWNRTGVTQLVKLGIGDSPAATRLLASGVVPGYLLGSRSMDEHQGYLRTASTLGRAPTSSGSQVTVLETQGNALVSVGTIEGIAKTEDLRSVRFDGDRAFLVTFKKTDPLYVVDLAQPTAPKLQGELKIPGFSTYMHRMDENHLLTVGYDAADQGDFAWFQGVLLQIFDVADANNPKLVHRAKIGTRGSSSEALTNPLAFSFDAARGLLALPLTLCEGPEGTSAYGTFKFSGLYVYRVNLQDGFKTVGRVPFPVEASRQSAMCNQWWTRATSEVRRSFFADDVVYSLSSNLLKINRLTSLEVDDGVFSLNTP